MRQRFSLSAVLLLMLTAAISLAYSHYKLLGQDEMFVLQTDGVATFRELLRIQTHYPISLDPIVYHALAHACTRMFGVNAFALRLPSLVGFLLMQACLYRFVRRCYNNRYGTAEAGRRAPRSLAEPAALMALAFPAVTITLFYSAEARPYGLLLGFYGLTLLMWQRATEVEVFAGLKGRTGTLITLALAIALTLNCHYFGILLLIPVWEAEMVRSILQRRFDWPVLAALILGMASEVCTLPFQHAAKEFRLHYYNVGQIGPRAITQAYRSLFVDYTQTSNATQHIAAIVFVVLALTLIAACFYRYREHSLPLDIPEATFVLTFAALPFFGFLIGYFVTHTLEVRYVLGAIVGVSILVGMVLAPSLRGRAATATVFAVLALTGIYRVVAERQHSRAQLAGMLPSDAVRAELAAHPDAPLYLQELGPYEVLSYYEPDLAVRRRMTLVYSAANEVQYAHHDTQSLTADHMRYFTALPIIRYEDLRQQPGGHLFILYHQGWDWTDQAFAADHAVLTPLGADMQGDAAVVRFRP